MHVSAFATARPPGIYKESYLDTLFDYFHEKRPSAVQTPPLPPWKTEEVRSTDPTPSCTPRLSHPLILLSRIP